MCSRDIKTIGGATRVTCTCSQVRTAELTAVTTNVVFHPSLPEFATGFGLRFAGRLDLRGLCARARARRAQCNCIYALFLASVTIYASFLASVTVLMRHF